ncbi:hypothetical protein GDO81_026058 [Engystomops pustulosus]|uniref:Uncharacterized protein n=1 Tax=Engystomops pustulosus TaxID=76066 RepID=A0AAV6YKI6_ENGPU|nr:hypothetical protein GDO81_026058 [Engystomops pustulosus]
MCPYIVVILFCVYTEYNRWLDLYRPYIRISTDTQNSYKNTYGWSPVKPYIRFFVIGLEEALKWLLNYKSQHVLTSDTCSSFPH